MNIGFNIGLHKRKHEMKLGDKSGFRQLVAAGTLAAPNHTQQLIVLHDPSAAARWRRLLCSLNSSPPIYVMATHVGTTYWHST